jgi:DNA invertase Pin-like site-specific DNA recombinase
VCLRTLRKGDTLVVWKLDRLARSLKDLVEIVHDLNGRQSAFAR